ncbi:MAG TPA: tetratricopeptide repeat protein [Candidatus Angelobacter sp.]|nr:tetratricopeptide repeat protein [Candidatus Angelobacter sp.]
MKSCCLILLTLLLPVQRWNATVTGRILDREGKPMSGATVTFKHVGTVDRDGLRVTEGTGQSYKIKTDKHGTFTLLGMIFGVYEVQVFRPDGKRVYFGEKNIGDPNDKTVKAQNDLQIDLSKPETTRTEAGAETNLHESKKTREQIDLIQQENEHKEKINRLIVQLQASLDAKDWTRATDLLHQLIELDPNRWEFYQNLATIQANLTHYQEAIASFGKGIDAAKKLLPNAADPFQLKIYIGDLFLSQGDAYNRLGKIDEALTSYANAVEISPRPATAYFHACNALLNNGRTSEAVGKCKLAIAADPNQWEFYQSMGEAQNVQGKSADALESYQQGAEVAKKMLEAQPDSGKAKTGLGQILNTEGNLLVHIRKYDQAIEVFNKAAEVSVYPAMPYFNLCATYYNMKRTDDAVAACDRAIASDPTLSDAYYIKATVLFGEGRTVGGKYMVPPGTTESLNKYLQYAPFGQHAGEVRGMIDKVDGEAQLRPARP